jgi:nucleotide-binding universal stress UspA family protein
MMQKILVPLDGSDLAEAVLPYVLEISQRCEAVSVILLQVVRPPGGHTATTFLPMDADFPSEMTPGSDVDVDIARHPIYRDQELASMRASVEVSLGPAARILEEKGIETRVDVAFGRAAQEIVRFAEQEEVDLIAMCTHGRSGVSRWILGSVADKVLRGTHLPVLLVRPEEVKSVPLPPAGETGR